MTSTRPMRCLIAAAAALSLCIPEPLLAATPNNPIPNVVDVKLLDGGVLLGQVVNPQGTAQSETPVVILAGTQELASTKTRQDGYFAFRGLRGGVYQLTTADGQGVCRLWTPGSAPPSAQEGMLLIAGSHTLRAQTYTSNGLFPRWNPGPVGFWLTNPWVIGGIVATAVAVPVIIHNTNDGPHSP